MSLKGTIYIALLVLLGGLVIERLDDHRGRITAWLDGPPEALKTDRLPGGDAILVSREQQLIRRVSKEYGRVKVNVDEAKRKGLRVEKLEPLLLDALAMARRKRYEQALTLLNRVDVSIPRPSEKVVPAHPEDLPPEEGSLRSKPVPRPKGAAKKKRRSR